MVTELPSISCKTLYISIDIFSKSLTPKFVMEKEMPLWICLSKLFEQKKSQVGGEHCRVSLLFLNLHFIKRKSAQFHCIDNIHYHIYPCIDCPNFFGTVVEKQTSKQGDAYAIISRPQFLSSQFTTMGKAITNRGSQTGFRRAERFR